MQARKTVAPGVSAGLLSLALAVTTPAEAQQVATLGVFQDWTAYTMTENGHKVCYVASQPKKDEGNYKKRGDIYALITHRPAQNQFSVVTVYAGYTYGSGATVTLEVDKNSFQLFTEGETAWAHDEMDKKIVQEMRRGSTMVVKGASSRGTKTTDSYSLRGVTAALQAIDKACNVR
ncbi:invasion associated locus B family protein [Pararhodospirillum photometricum]|nr:invasion associated locus B family protein [Pararhodospirillum photometricum]